MQSLYAYYKAGEQSIDMTEKEMFFSINKAYSLYHYLLLLIIDISRYAEDRIDLARQKRIPTTEDLHPNTKFIDNKLVQQISNNRQLNTYLSNTKLSWVNYPELIKKIYSTIKDSDCYKKYMSIKEPSFKDDTKVIVDIYEHVILNCEDLYIALEEQSIYWNDDIEFITSMIIKTIRKFNQKDNENAPLMDLYKNIEDRQFARTLFRSTIKRHDETLPLIEKFTTNWDIDRIAFMDILIMQITITEIMEFISIPTKVSFNEYIEIAKFYSTSKSSVFINGILDKIISHLKDEKKITKSGRGLIGEV